MGATVLSLLILAAPCVNTSTLTEGAPAPCTGLLWSVDKSKAALKCARVELPRCESERDLNRALLNAQLTKPPPPPSDPPSAKWRWALGGVAGGLVVGFVAGVVAR